MTEHDLSRASEHDSDRGTDHATSAAPEPTPLPRRRDIHRPTAPHTPRRHRHRGLPVALTVMALSTGMATGVAAAATAERAPAAPVPSTGPAPAATARTVTVGTDLAGPSSQAVADAQAALARAKIVTADSLSVTGKERKRITTLAEQVRELVADSPTGERAPAAASRSTEREPLDERADAGRTDAAGAGTADDAAAPETGAKGEKSGTPAPEPVAPGDAAPVGAAPLVLPAAADAISPETLELPAVAPGTGGASGAPDGDATARADGAASRTDAERPALSTATRSLRTVLDQAQGTDAEIEPAPATPAEILDAQARAARDAAPMLARHADDTSGYENGRIPGGDLCELSFAPGETLRCDAAEQLERLDTAFRARFGAHLSVRDSYRSYDSQVAVKASKGYLAAVPGYSNHGWGVAVDLNDGVQDFGSAQYAWLREHAPDFGWDNPGWARSDGRKPEAWHWEYTPLR